MHSLIQLLYSIGLHLTFAYPAWQALLELEQGLKEVSKQEYAHHITSEKYMKFD
jgi:hypothetical protein